MAIGVKERKQILAGATALRKAWNRAVEGAQNLHEAREHLRFAEAAGETRSREYKELEQAFLNRVRGEVMSTIDSTGPQRIPRGRS